MDKACVDPQYVLPGLAAVFHDSLLTPWRDSIRKSRPVRWLIPVGTQDMQTDLKYVSTGDERPPSRPKWPVARADRICGREIDFKWAKK